MWLSRPTAWTSRRTSLRRSSRFANSGLGHRCAQVATDTSQKLPQRFPDTIRSRLERGLPIDAISEVLALWAWSTLGRTVTGRPRTVDDPLADLYEGIAERAAGDPSNLATALLSLEEIFGDLAGRAELVRPVTDHLTVLLERLNR